MRTWLRKVRWWIASFYSIMTGSALGWSAEVEKELREKYYQNRDEKEIARGLVMMFDGRCVHGGLTDRLRGMTSAYLFCRDKGIPFYIYHVHPFQLEKYLEPNVVDWRISEHRLSYDWNRVMMASLYDFAIYPSLHHLFLEKLVKQAQKSQKKQIHLYSNSKFYDSYFQEAFTELFKPSAALQAAIDYHMKAIGGGKYISISFRFTTLLGDFEDCVNQPLPVGEQEALMEGCLKEIRKLDNQSPKHDAILVTADSEKFLRKLDCLKDDIRIYVIPGKVGHFDHSEADEEDSEMKTFLDYFMISQAEKVYLAKSGKMYNSGFCRHAAMLGNRPFELVEF